VEKADEPIQDVSVLDLRQITEFSHSNAGCPFANVAPNMARRIEDSPKGKTHG
jgi:hypothetical protein